MDSPHWIIPFVIWVYGKFVIIQLKRFSHHNNKVVKNIYKVKCNANISIIVENMEVSETKYKLIATINHTGNLERGHYSSFVKLFSSDD